MFVLLVKGNTSSWFMSASSPCGSYQRRLHRSHVTSIDNSFGRKSEELSEEVSSKFNFDFNPRDFDISHIESFLNFVEVHKIEPQHTYRLYSQLFKSLLMIIFPCYL